MFPGEIHLSCINNPGFNEIHIFSIIKCSFMGNSMFNDMMCSRKNQLTCINSQINNT